MSVPEKTLRTTAQLNRRVLLRCAALCGAAGPLLVACGSDDEPSGTAPETDTSDTGNGTSGGNGGGGNGGAGGLVAAADVPVGGGVVLDGIIVTQPSDGEFVGYPTVCTHQGGAITAVSDKGVMTCSLHGSQFSIEDGANLVGPNGAAAGSTADLEPIELTVKGSQVLRA